MNLKEGENCQSSVIEKKINEIRGGIVEHPQWLPILGALERMAEKICINERIELKPSECLKPR